MNWVIVVPSVFGAVFGALGWLLVGLYIQRRQYGRQAINASRAVYFEIAMNRLAVEVAREYQSFSPLSRGAFDRLLPELATWFSPVDLQAIVAAYLGHLGYEQARENAHMSEALRRQSLSGILAAQERALDTIRHRAFSRAETAELLKAGGQSLALVDEAAD